MKSYDLYFQRDGKVYVVNARLNELCAKIDELAKVVDK